MTARNTSKAILVAGMHRGGTSAFTRVINLLGADLPGNLMPPSPANAKGYWEPMEIVALHDELLASVGSRWDDIATSHSTLPDLAAFSGFKARMLEILRRDFANSALFVLKDPRISRLLPLWLSVLREFGAEPRFVIPVRHPIEVAESLQARDGIVAAKAHLMWLQQLLIAEKRSRGYPRCFVSYDALLSDWHAVAAQMSRQLGIDWPHSMEHAAAEIESFLSVQDRHHTHSPGNLTASPETADWVKRAYAEAMAACEGQTIRAGVLDSILLNMQSAGLIYDPIIAQLSDRGHAPISTPEIQQISREIAGEVAALAAGNGDKGDQDDVIARLMDEIERLKGENAAQGIALAADEAELAARDAKLAGLAAEVNRMSQQTAELAAALAARHREIAERDARIANQAQQIRATSAVLRHIEESRVWRATYPIRVFGTWVKSWLGRLGNRSIVIHPVAYHHLRQTDTGAWETTGDDPAILLMPAGGRFPAGGWVSLNIEFESEKRSLPVRPSLYLDCGSGFSEAGRYMLPMPSRGRIEFIFRAPAKLHSLRFDPTEQPLRFWIGRFSIREIGKAEVAARVFASVLPLMFSRNRPGIRGLYARWRREGSAGVKSGLIALYGRGNAWAEANYDVWIKQFDVLGDDDRQAIRARIEQFHSRPLISIVMPVYNTPDRYLRAAIESVCSQLYPFWELCIADDASTRPHVRKILSEWQDRDSRIRVIFRPKNGHISAASNSALSLATGEFIALLDHDDVLPEHALYMVAEELNAHPDADLIYSDEDKLDQSGKRYSPHFKPDWNRELFYSQNYISHLGVYRTSLVRNVGGFREGYEGSQDYDLALRCIQHVQSSRIRHIPAILYHWRVVAGSTAGERESKSYATLAGIKALQDHFRHQEGVEILQGPYSTTYRVRYPVPAPPPKASIIIPTRDGCHILRKCVDSIRAKTDYGNHEIIIVDNQSRDPQTLNYLDELSREHGIRVLGYNHPFNFSAINNFAVEHATGEIVVLLNNDVEVISPAWLTEMVSHAVRADVGAVGAKLYYSDGRIQHAGVIIGLGGVAGHSHKYYAREAPGYFNRLNLVQEISAVTAACLVIRREVFRSVGGLDEENLKIAFNDVDFCLRLREHGYRNVWTPFAELYHHESISRGQDDTPEKKNRFESEVKYMKARWGKKLHHDPAYSPYLTLDQEDFSMARAPRVDLPWRKRTI